MKYRYDSSSLQENKDHEHQADTASLRRYSPHDAASLQADVSPANAAAASCSSEAPVEIDLKSDDGETMMQKVEKFCTAGKGFISYADQPTQHLVHFSNVSQVQKFLKLGFVDFAFRLVFNLRFA